MSVQPAPIRISYFQELEKIDESQCYATIVNNANQVFNDNYKPAYLSIVTEMEQLRVEWEADQQTATHIDLAHRVSQINQYHALRDEAKVSLEKIRGAYERAIHDCQPP